MNSKRSSVHMRTLSRLGVDLGHDIHNANVAQAIKGDSDLQDVTGLSGRLRLQKAPTDKSTSMGASSWMDKQRQHIQAYEYLCHIGEAKEWIEGCLGEQIPAIVDLEESLRNGIVLARLARTFMPDLVPRIYEAAKLQFRHSDNINRFFHFVDRVALPENFRFELTDLYEKKNLPKVIYCIHALSFVLVSAGLARKIGNLVGKLQFTEDELRKTQRSLDATGVAMPNFKDVGNAVAGNLDPCEVATERAEDQERNAIEQSMIYIVAAQTQARAFLLRQQIRIELSRLEELEVSIILAQSAARGLIVRQQYYQNAHTYRDINNWALILQAASRGYLIRCDLSFRQASLSLNTSWALAVQTLCRGYMERKTMLARATALNGARDKTAVILLQGIIRGHLVRRASKDKYSDLCGHESSIMKLQTLSRGYISRQNTLRLTGCLSGITSCIVDLQTHCRSTLVRSRYREICRSSHDPQSHLSTIAPISAGFLMRKKFALFANLLYLEEDLIVDVQSLCRAMLVRLHCNQKLISLAHAEYSIVNFQAAAIGSLHRRRYRGRQAHYKRNMERVIKVQSFIRARQQGAAYRSLIVDDNPPISTIKNFLHLLNDSNFDFEEEIAMEQGRKDVIQSIRQNEAAEEHIEQMDVKIALLVKQAIKIDELIQHQRHMDKGLGMSQPDTNPFDLKAMNKVARSQLENYQRFFYILQTQPVYLARLFSQDHVSQSKEKEEKRLESLIMIMYGYAQKKREEYFLLRLIRASVIKEVSMVHDIEEYLQGRYLWNRILSTYLKGANHHKFLRELLIPVIRTVAQDDFLDLESDPLIIYRTIREDEESRTGQSSRRPVHVSQEYAIQDPDTRVMFIKHLRDLRDLTDHVLDRLVSDLSKAPYAIRYVARETCRSMQEHIQHTNPHDLHRLVGHLFCRQFITPALITPEHYNLLESEITPIARKNLAELSKILNQIASGRRFEEGSYLQPLNEFVDRAIDRMSITFSKLIDVEDLESHYNITELDDIIATKRPILYIKVSDIFALHSMVANSLEQVAPEAEDPLHHVLMQLGPPPTRAEDMMIMSISNSEIALTLDPKAIDVDDPEADERALFMQTKRNVLYIIRIQSGISLLDILIQPITEEDEVRWREIVREEQIQQTRRNSTCMSGVRSQDMSRLSYPMLKRECLENVVKLERLGWITRENNYQELLNSIADDIRSQNRRRIERQQELKSTQEMLSDLREKRAYLDGQLKSYNDYIEQAMMSLQSKKSKKKAVLPFTKQYYHMRDLQKAGRIPKFGSRKYSAAKLYDKGVLISIRNEQPPFEKFNITISSDHIGEFVLQSTTQGATTQGSRALVQLDELLQAQYNKCESIEVLDGAMTLRVSLMLNLVFKHFFSQ